MGKMKEYERDEKYRWLADVLILIFALSMIFGLVRIVWLGIAWIAHHVQIV